jgi:hypothetical protein
MLGFEDWDFFIGILKAGGTVYEIPFPCLYYRKKEWSMFDTVCKNESQVFRDQVQLYKNHQDVYARYFGSPIKLIQENEKMKEIIRAYHQSDTYRVGLKIGRLKKLFTRRK